MQSNTQIDTAIEKFLEQNAICVEDLTKEQLAKVLKEAILCGDFQRHVLYSNNAQAISYIPYRRQLELEERIKHLEEELETLQLKAGILADM